jgi:tRNA dimethylallyltransferase
MAKASHHSPPSLVYNNHCVFLAGPTAVGKSEIALLLAQKIGGEIISVDSMQVYRGLDIGTAKPSVEERACVPHHLIDIVGLTEQFDAAQFVRLANAALKDIQSRGRIPIFCGGTGLYFKAFLEGLGDSPAADEALRRELDATPLEDLLCELAERDPVAHGMIDKKNPRRVIRAVEVIRLTGKPFSQQRAEWSGVQSSRFKVQSPEPTAVIGLTRDATDLRARIDDRVDVMFARGLVEETRRLLDRGLAKNKTAMQALGYRQVAEHLRGERSLPETIELVKVKTRQFAKRQMTWFRKQMDVNWIELTSEISPAEIISNFINHERGAGN